MVGAFALHAGQVRDTRAYDASVAPPDPMDLSASVTDSWYSLISLRVARFLRSHLPPEGFERRAFRYQTGAAVGCLECEPRTDGWVVESRGIHVDPSLL